MELVLNPTVNPKREIHQLSDDEYIQFHQWFLQNPDEWPYWPVLPLKRSWDHSPSAALVIDHQRFYTPNADITLFYTNLWELPTEPIGHTGVSKINFEKLCAGAWQVFSHIGAVTAAGWRVD